MSITHTLEESKKILESERYSDALNAILRVYQNAPLTFSEMEQLGVPDEIIQWLFIMSPKVPDNLKRQLANYNCEIASDYCENTDLIEKQNKNANAKEAAWWTGTYLRGSVRFKEYGSSLEIKIYIRQADYICKICDDETLKEKAA